MESVKLSLLEDTNSGGGDPRLPRLSKRSWTRQSMIRKGNVRKWNLGESLKTFLCARPSEAVKAQRRAASSGGRRAAPRWPEH